MRKDKNTDKPAKILHAGFAPDEKLKKQLEDEESTRKAKLREKLPETREDSVDDLAK